MGMETVSATAATIIPATVEPYGSSSKNATNVPSSDAYGISKMVHQMEAAAPAMTEVTTSPNT